MNVVLETERLCVRWFEASDALFVLELVNEPAWIRYIGDKNIKTLDEAARYIERGPLAMYRQHGYGLYAVDVKATGRPVGMCGLIKREALEDVDLGFAFLERAWGNGYAVEAAHAVTRYGFDVFALPRIVAILSPDNSRSCRVLEKIGFRSEGTVRLERDEELALYAIAAAR